MCAPARLQRAAQGRRGRCLTSQRRWPLGARCRASRLFENNNLGCTIPTEFTGLTDISDMCAPRPASASQPLDTSAAACPASAPQPPGNCAAARRGDDGTHTPRTIDPLRRWLWNNQLTGSVPAAVQKMADDCSCLCALGPRRPVPANHSLAARRGPGARWRGCLLTVRRCLRVSGLLLPMRAATWVAATSGTMSTRR